jgi:hypothetical protein
MRHPKTDPPSSTVMIRAAISRTCSSVCRLTRPAASTSSSRTAGSLNMVDPRKDHPRFFCMDCDVDTYVNEQFYMLKDRLWRRINPSIDGMLCLRCAETRLGRPLHRGDFKTLPVNFNQARICPELAARLARDP